jgi:hypothetical protein
MTRLDFDAFVRHFLMSYSFCGVGETQSAQGVSSLVLYALRPVKCTLFILPSNARIKFDSPTACSVLAYLSGEVEVHYNEQGRWEKLPQVAGAHYNVPHGQPFGVYSGRCPGAFILIQQE